MSCINWVYFLTVTLLGWGSSVSAASIDYSGIHIPDQAGKVQTVSGLVDPHTIGSALMHEHLLGNAVPPLDQWQSLGRRPPTTAEELRRWNEPFTMEKRTGLLGLYGKGPLRIEANRDAFTLDRIEDAVDEVRAYRALGGTTVVDVSSIGVRVEDHARKLKEVATRTGAQIVLGSGFYRSPYYQKGMDKRTTADLTKQIVRELVEGVDGTEIKAGIIGEVPVENLTLLPEESVEVRVLRAVARSSRLTGAAISLHCTCVPSSKFDDMHAGLDLLEAEGVDLSRVIVGHAISADLASPDDTQVLESLLRRGVYLQFDLFAFPGLEMYQGSLLVALRKLIRQGYAKQLLVSHDMSSKLALTRYGGAGLTYVNSVVVPYLQAQGVNEIAIKNILQDNPRRVLAFVSPRRL